MGRSSGAKVLRWVGVGVAAVVVLVVALALALDTDAVSGRVKALVVPRVSAALGRELTVADARLRIFPNPRVVLGNATLAGRPGEPPLMKLESFDVEVGLWPLVRSLGKDVRVHGVALVRPEVNLVRGRDGHWNYEGLGSGATDGKGDGAPTAQGGEPVRFGVDQATLVDGTLKVIDLAQGRSDQAVALTRMDLSAHGGPGAPVSMTFSAALAGADKNLELALDSPLLPADLAEGGWPELKGRLAIKGLQLAQLRGFFPADLAAMTRGGKVDVSADVRSEGGGYRLDGKGALSELRLRGEPASGSFTVEGHVGPKGPARVEVKDLVVKGPGVDLGGSATVETSPVRARFAIAGPLLDLGTVLGLAPADPAKKPEPPPPGGALLPPAMQQQVAAIAVAGTVDIQKVVDGKLTATDVKGRAVLSKGVLSLEQARAKLYDGDLDASGTTVHLAEATPRWNLKARLDRVDLGGAMQAITGAAPVVGRLTGTLDLAGAGADWEHVKKALTGSGALALAGGALTTTDIGDKALAAVSQGLSRAGRGGAAQKLTGYEGGRTSLEDLAASFTVQDGFMRLTRPMSFRSKSGEARLGGRVGLSQELALDGAITLSKDLLARAGAGGVLGGGLDVPLRLGGTLGSPSVEIAAEDAVASAVRGAAKKLVTEKGQQVQGEVKKQARERVRGLLDRFSK